MRRLTTSALAAGAAIIMLCGCGGGDNPRAGGTTVTVTATQTVVSAGEPEATGETTASAPDQGPVSLGDKVRLRLTELKVRKVKPLSSGNAYIDRDAGKGNVWMGALVDGCMPADAARKKISISWSPWSLQGPRGELYTASGSVWDNFPPAPQYPSYNTFVPGDCWTGWILFAVPTGGEITGVHYDNTADLPTTWHVG